MHRWTFRQEENQILTVGRLFEEIDWEILTEVQP